MADNQVIPEKPLAVLQGDTFDRIWSFTGPEPVLTPIDLTTVFSDWAAVWSPFAGSILAVPFVIDDSDASNGNIRMTLVPSLVTQPLGYYKLTATDIVSSESMTIMRGPFYTEPN